MKAIRLDQNPVIWCQETQKRGDSKTCHIFGEAQMSQLALVDFEVETWVKLYAIAWHGPAVNLSTFSPRLVHHVQKYQNANFNP